MMILQQIHFIDIMCYQQKSIDNKPFFDQPVKNKQEADEKLIEISRSDGYTTENLLDFSYH